MQQSDEEKVKYILTEIGNMEKIIAGKKANDLMDDLILERAVSMTLQMISEKVGKITDEFQQRHTQIEWARIKGLRNRISHEYENLDFDIIFSAATESLQELKEKLLQVDFSQKI